MKIIPEVQKKAVLTVLGKKKTKGQTTSTSYIIKFTSDYYPYLTERENLVMNMAEECHIRMAEHTLLKTKKHQYLYAIKRMDKTGDRKIPMEDFCQFSQRLTEDKYRGSYESLGEIIDRYSDKPMVDKTELLYRLLFCFITGNNDMHLKNFSLISLDDKGYQLSDTYDLLNVTVLNS